MLRQSNEEGSYANFNTENRGKHCPPSSSNLSHFSGTCSFEQYQKKISGFFSLLDFVVVAVVIVLYRKWVRRLVPYSRNEGVEK